MRRLLFAIVVCLCALPTWGQFSTTTNLQLKKPNHLLTSNWDTYLNGDMDTLDSYLGGVGTLTANSVMPSITNVRNWVTANNLATGLINFLGGFPGQQINVLCGDTNTTMVSGANITLGASFSCANSSGISLVLNGAVWVEIGRSASSTISISGDVIARSFQLNGSNIFNLQAPGGSCPGSSTYQFGLSVGDTTGGTMIWDTLGGACRSVLSLTSNLVNGNLSVASGTRTEADSGVAAASGKITPVIYATATNCAANGTAANPSVVSCSAASAGMFSCSTSASTGTCQVNTTAVTANSEIMITQDAADGGAGQLNVTCNTANVLNTSKPLLVSKSSGTSFTINLGTVATNPACFEYHIVN